MSKSDDMRKLIDIANNNKMVSETYATERDNEASPFKAFASWGNADILSESERVSVVYVDEMALPKKVSPDFIKDYVDQLHTGDYSTDDEDVLEWIYRFDVYELKTIPIADLSLRFSGIDQSKVNHYSRHKTEYPPIVVDGDSKWIMDGYHRANAAAARGDRNIKAYVGVNQRQDELDEMALPADWDPTALGHDKTFKSRLEYALQRARRLGGGSSRVAFVIPDNGRETVLKIAKNNKGTAQNEAVALMKKKHPKKNFEIKQEMRESDDYSGNMKSLPKFHQVAGAPHRHRDDPDAYLNNPNRTDWSVPIVAGDVWERWNNPEMKVVIRGRVGGNGNIIISEPDDLDSTIMFAEGPFRKTYVKSKDASVKLEEATLMESARVVYVVLTHDLDREDVWLDKAFTTYEAAKAYRDELAGINNANDHYYKIETVEVDFNFTK